MSRDVQKIICEHIHGAPFLSEKYTPQNNCILINPYIAILWGQ